MGSPYRTAAPPERRVWFLPDTRRDRLILLGLAIAFGLAIVAQGIRASTQKPRTLTNDQVLAVVAQHRVDLRERCFTPRREIEGASVMVELVVDAEGEVRLPRATSSSPVLDRCVEGEVRGWRFPVRPGADDETLHIPIVFERT